MLDSKQLSNSTMTKQELQHLVDFHRSVMPLVLADIEREARGVRLFYALDFCELHNYIFSEFRPTDLAIQYYLENMKHPMILLPPTVLEMLRHLENLSTWYRHIYHPKADVIERFLKADNVQEFLAKVDQVASVDDFREVWDDFSKLRGDDRKILNFLFDDTSSQTRGAPGQTLKELSEDGRLRLAEIVWEEFDEGIFSEAYRLFKRRRPTLDKRFANRVDAMNVAIIFTLNNTYASEGIYFSLVTSGKYTHDIWSSLKWSDDPFLEQGLSFVGLEETPLSRTSEHCAFHAYFDGTADRLQIARMHLIGLAKTGELLRRKPRLTDGEMQWLDLFIEHCRDIDRAIGRIPPPLRLKDRFLKVQSREEIEEEIGDLLKEGTRELQESTSAAYELVETSLSNYPFEIIDHDSGEFIEAIVSPSSIPIEPAAKRARLVAQARLPKGAKETLYVGREYKLETQIYWHIPEEMPDRTSLQDTAIDFDIVIYAEDMEVKPTRSRRYTLEPGKKSEWLGSTLIPRKAGPEKRICLYIYYKGHFISMLEYERNVLEVPTTSEQETYPPIRSAAIDNRELHILPEHIERPIEVRLFVSHTPDDRYEVTVMWKGQSKPIRTKISKHDKAAINRDMQACIEQIVTACSGKYTSDEVKLRNLEDLAYQGHFAYTMLFPKPEDRQFIQNALAGSKSVAIGITSVDPLFPLELLYDHGMEEKPDYEHFWGMRYIIWRDIASHDTPALRPEIPIKQVPRVTLLPNTDLIHVRDREVPFFDGLSRHGKIALSRWYSSSPQDREEKLRFSKFLSSESDLTHFTCHVVTEPDDDPGSTYIELSNRFRVSVKDFDVYNVQMKNYPLVVLNACRTSIVNPLYTSNLATVIQAHGGRGVVATESRVPDAFGADFTEQLYSRLIIDERRELGESLLEVKRYFLREQNNPLGLLYTLYGPPGIKLFEP